MVANKFRETIWLVILSGFEVKYVILKFYFNIEIVFQNVLIWVKRSDILEKFT